MCFNQQPCSVDLSYMFGYIYTLPTISYTNWVVRIIDIPLYTTEHRHAYTEQDSLLVSSYQMYH